MNGMFLKLAVAALVVVAGWNFTSLALAGAAPSVTSFSGTEQTTAGIGLCFEFGDNVAEVVGTVRHTWTDINNTVTGGLAELAFPIIGKDQFAPKVAVKGLIGSTGVQGLGGVGYDFANQQPFVGIGAQGPYVEGGLNYLFDGQFNPYIGANTFGNAPERTVVSVPPA